MDSILNQTYVHIEILLIDDGSPDMSGVICQEYVEQDERVRYYRKENGGLSDARNYGIERANGDFLFFVDSDDWLVSNAIEDLVTAQKKHGAEVVIATHNQFVEDEASYNFRALEEQYYEQVFSKKSFMEELPLLETRDSAFITAWGTLWKSSLFDKLKFPVGRICEDLGTSYKLYLTANSIVFIHKALYWYRVRENSIMTGEKIERIIGDIVYFYLQRIALLSMKGYDVQHYKSQFVNDTKYVRLPAIEQAGITESVLKEYLVETLFLIEKQ